MKKVTQVLYSGLGGHGSVAFSLYKGDAQKQVAHQFVFFGIEELREEYRQKCIEEKIPYTAIIIKNINKIQALWKAFQAIRKQSPHTVILHSIILFPIVPLLRMFGIQIISVDHTPNSTKTKSEWLAIKFLKIFAHYQVYLTLDQYQDNLSRFGNDFYRGSHPVIINNGLDIQKFSPGAHAFKNEKVQLFMQARFSKTKDFQTLIQSIQILKSSTNTPFHLFLAGDGETWDECVKLSKELQVEDCVSFLGMVPEDTVIEYLRKTDLYIHSSLSETMSTAIMQAMAVGVPCLVSDIPGNKSLVNDQENGWWFETKNANDLAIKISNLIDQEGVLNEMSKKSRKYAEDHLGMETMFDKYFKLVK